MATPIRAVDRPSPAASSSRIDRSVVSIFGDLSGFVESVNRKRAPSSSNCGSGNPASRHARNSAAPLFDQAEFVKHAADYVIPQLRYALPDVFNRQTSREEAGILNLDPIVENGDAQWRT